MKKLLRTELKSIVGGCETVLEAEEENSAVICTSCIYDNECSNGHICRASRSCIESKVCALPYYC